MRSRIKYQDVPILAAMAGLAAFPAARADSPYATELIGYNANVNSTYGPSLYNDPNSVLGEPASIAINSDPGAGDDPFHIKIVEPAYNTDLNGNKLLYTLSRGRVDWGTPHQHYEYGSVTVKFDHAVYDDPANPYGIDLNVFGNAFYVGNGYVSDASDMRSYTLAGGIFAEPMLISVSPGYQGLSGETQDNPDSWQWYTYSSGPYCDAAFPTQGYEWSAQQYDATGNGWTNQKMDFTKPVNPTLNAILGVPGHTMSAQQAIQGYVGSGGGTGIDLGESGFERVQYVRVEAAAGFVDGEVDAFSDVRPMRVGEALSITPANAADGTPLFFQSTGDITRTAVLAQFLEVSDLARLSTSDLTGSPILASLHEGRLLAAYGLDVTALLETGAVDFLADYSLLPGLSYAGNGSDLQVFAWDGEAWQSTPFAFDTDSGMVRLEGWMEGSSAIAISQAPEPASLAFAAMGSAAMLLRRRRR